MKKHTLIALVFIMVLGRVGRVSAQDPTATPTPTYTPPPTLTPTTTLATIAPTATSKYQGLRPTPSPITIVPNYDMATSVASFGIKDKTGTFADSVINTYRVLNFGGIADFISFAGLLIICVIYLVRIWNKLNSHQE